ncbi:hypothetical protein [Cecembia lonarensis]|uniref:Lipoprotein n=1 Tax=Cecembia lonarensis (strain CCUG 58316 / KCTC 22772 / LW9) TaxID=1225176 RepID=K1LJS8_CECL9|nr:hypothetical protein [Cecembia lonarensis]EKB50578.1 hypothetical protein B879_00781 [Cecembia lonarensis LW9]
MRELLPISLVLLFSILSCSGRNEGFENFTFFLEKTINFENEMYAIHNMEFRGFEDSLLYGYDIGRAAIFKFDQKGNLLESNRFQNGENEIDLLTLRDVYPVNRDSIFIVESGYNNLLLLDGNLKIINSWNIRKLTDSKVNLGRSNPQIVNFDYIDQVPYITLVAMDGDLDPTEKEFFEESFLAAKINLLTGEFIPMFKYPNESPYRKYLFWGDESAYILYHENKYYVTFPLDPNLYVFTEHSNDYHIIYYTGELNKSTTGVNFGMNQSEFLENHYLEVFHIKNDFNLISKSILKISDKKYFVRAVRKAINVNNIDSKDINTFRLKGPKQDFILQIFELEEDVDGQLWKEFLLPKHYKNYSFIDQEGKFYFKENNEESEKYSIDVLTWSFNDLSKL